MTVTSTIGAGLPIAYIPDFRDRAVADMPAPLREAPRIRALCRAIGAVFQAVEDDQFDLIMTCNLATGEGVILDRIGDIVGEARGVFDDATYRRFLRARIAANRSQGSPEEMITIFQLVTAPSVVEHLRLPGGVQLTAFRESFMDDAVRTRVRAIMNDARPLGVAIDLVEALTGWVGFRDRDPDYPAGPAGTLTTGTLARTI